VQAVFHPYEDNPTCGPGPQIAPLDLPNPLTATLYSKTGAGKSQRSLSMAAARCGRTGVTGMAPGCCNSGFVFSC